MLSCFCDTKLHILGILSYFFSFFFKFDKPLPSGDNNLNEIKFRTVSKDCVFHSGETRRRFNQF